MKKLVNLYVPAVDIAFDMMAPVDLDIAMLTSLLAEGVAQMCSGKYVVSHLEQLTLRNPDRLLNPQKTLEAYDVDDGAGLILF